MFIEDCARCEALADKRRREGFYKHFYRTLPDRETAKLSSDDLPEETKTAIYDDLAAVTRVNSRPLTESEWIDRLEAAGFDVTWIDNAPMALLSPRRVIADEGLLRTLQFGYNVLTTPAARRRLSAMRSVLAKYDAQLNAVAVVAETQ